MFGKIIFKPFKLYIFFFPNLLPTLVMKSQAQRQYHKQSISPQEMMAPWSILKNITNKINK
jgi:hypothetical protein